MTYGRLTWINPARPDHRAEVTLCHTHSVSLLRTLKALGLGAAGAIATPAESADGCEYCRGRETATA